MNCCAVLGMPREGERCGRPALSAINGNLYGTTEECGANTDGTVFGITPSGTLTTLYNFCSQSGCADGGRPTAGLIQATDGNFHGTTGEGGAHSLGTVFEITPGGVLRTLHSFCAQSGCRDGSFPLTGVVQATDGNFYGTTNLGGAKNDGTVFEITPSGSLTTCTVFARKAVAPMVFSQQRDWFRTRMGLSTERPPSAAGPPSMARSSAYPWGWDRS